LGTCELRGKGREINKHPLKDKKVKGREIIQIDNTQITLYKKGERALGSTSSQSSKPCEVAQYPQHGVGTRTHTHMQTFSCSPPSTHTHINKHTNINTHTLTASPYTRSEHSISVKEPTSLLRYLRKICSVSAKEP